MACTSLTPGDFFTPHNRCPECEHPLFNHTRITFTCDLCIVEDRIEQVEELLKEIIFRSGVSNVKKGDNQGHTPANPPSIGMEEL